MNLKRLGRNIMKKTSKALLDVMFPEHERSSCSDANPVNAMAITENWTLEHKCKRCTMLKLINEMEPETKWQ